MKPNKVSPEEYYNTFVRSPSGAKVLEDMKRAHYFYGSTFSKIDGEQELREGGRNAVLRILTILDNYEESKNAR
mgnify:CR=1 FL=1